MHTRLLTILLFGLLATETSAQNTRNIAWFIPSACFTEKINGLAIGPWSGCMQYYLDSIEQTINGIDLEIIGIGLLLPLAGSPIDLEKNLSSPKQIVNGLAISPGGVADRGFVMNGINISGLSTLTLKSNGLTLGGLYFSLHSKVNGISMGGGIVHETFRLNGISVGGLFANETQHLKGLQIGGAVCKAKTARGVQVGVSTRAKKLRGIQIGLYNQADNFKGLQIGLWNKSRKRMLPFLNFQF